VVVPPPAKAWRAIGSTLVCRTEPFSHGHDARAEPDGIHLDIDRHGQPTIEARLEPSP
jgi:hypothetical protein